MPSTIDKKLAQYEYLAHEYANKVFNYERYGFEREDIVQEMHIKIYLTILSFAERWKEYRATGQRKPAPLIFWIRKTLSNKVIDYIKLFNQDRVENVDKISIEDNNFDMAKFSDATLHIDVNAAICEINGLDVLQNLKGDRRKCYCMWIYGYTVKELSKMFPNISVPNVVTMQNDFLKKRRSNELYDFHTQSFQVQQFEEN